MTSGDVTSVVNEMQRRYGGRALYRGRDLPGAGAVLSTGCAPLDALLGGGLPQGRLTELLAAGTSGRGALVARTLARAQRAGHLAVYIDLARSIDLETLVRAEADLDALIIVQPLGFAHALEITRDLLVAGAGFIVFDRLDEQYEGPAHPDADLLNRALREWNVLLSHSRSALVFLTEASSPTDYPPSYSLPFFAGLRLRCEWHAWLWTQQRLAGYRARITVLKNKVSSSEGRSLMVRISVEG